ncbi:MAG TPA: hypothetical protein VEZ90_08985 [Blastocatellia bacterium]|nr:hypothetical protein [Blastocatellia bacterium]
MTIKPDQLARQLAELHGDNLYSIVQYGSSVGAGSGLGGGDDAGSSESHSEHRVHRLLVVLQQIGPSDLKRVRDVLQKWHQAGNPIPTYFTLEEIRDASDVFPIEFLDMSQRRKVLAGQDPFVDLQIPLNNLRHQVEYELRSKLIRLRALYLPASSQSGRLATLMFDSLQSFAVVFRHVIHLLGGEPPSGKQKSISKLCELLKLDHSVFAQVERFGPEGAPMLEAETEQIFAAYLSQIERIIEAVDSLPDSGS